MSLSRFIFYVKVVDLLCFSLNLKVCEEMQHEVAELHLAGEQCIQVVSCHFTPTLGQSPASHEKLVTKNKNFFQFRDREHCLSLFHGKIKLIRKWLIIRICTFNRSLSANIYSSLIFIIHNTLFIFLGILKYEHSCIYLIITTI